jgi:small subunit ribosomal protein S20
MLKSTIKDIISSKTKEDAEKILQRTSSLLDKLASKRIIHRNKAANQKSRLTIFVNNL